jgi:hypothetical protein
MIKYMPESDELVIEGGTSSGGVTGIAYIYYDVSNTSVSKVVYEYNDTNLNFSYTAQASMNISIYTKSSSLQFTATSGDPYKYGETTSGFQEICNKGVQFAMTTGDAVLLTNLLLKLSDIGFTSY